MAAYLAIDIGGGGGRGIAGTLEGDRLTLEELCRFDNYHVPVGNRYYWDAFYLFHQMLQTLEKMERNFPGFDSFGIDMWGNDFALLDANGQLTGAPRCTRNSKGEGMRRFFREVMSPEEYFMECGSQIRYGNAVFQLYERILEEDPALRTAKKFLMFPDLFGYLFTGRYFTEYTIGTTGQLIDPGTGSWNRRLIGKLGLPDTLFGEILMPGAQKLSLLQGLFAGQREAVKYVPAASHDTASAVTALALEEDEAFASSGTWSIIGTEVEKPVVNKEVLRWNFSNEGTADGKWRLQKDVMGMWVMQNLFRIWNREYGPLTWDEIVCEAEKAEPFRSLVNLEEAPFISDADPVWMIKEYCLRSGQPVPGSIGEIARCVYESMAVRYKYTIGQTEALTGRKFKRLRIVGGAGKNRFLDQMIADVTGIAVSAGPYEGACIGNILMQAEAAGQISGKKQFKSILQGSCEQQEFLPQKTALWEGPVKRYGKLCESVFI